MSSPQAGPRCRERIAEARVERFGAIPEHVDCGLARDRLEEAHALAVLDADATDEAAGEPAGLFVDALDERRFEREPQILGANAAIAQTRNVVGKRGDNEIVAAEVFVGR